jgi:hypothetical protein
MNAATTATGRAVDRRIPYPFDPTPKLVRRLRRDKKLKRGDAEVLGVLLSFRRAFRDSCWCSVPKIAAELGLSERTVQYALARLEAAGVIRQVRVAGPNQPDPDEPRNRTGWRIYFLFITERTDLPPGPDRRPPGERRRGDPAPRDDAKSCIISPPEMMQGIAPTPDAGFCIQSEDSLSSNRDASEDLEGPGGPDADLDRRQRRAGAGSDAPLGMPWHWQDRPAEPAPEPVRPATEVPPAAPAAPVAPEAPAPQPPQPRRFKFPDPATAPADDPVIAAERARQRASRERNAAVAPPEIPPTDTAELIRRLPDAPPHWVQIATEDLVRRFGSEKDRKLWPQLHRIVLGVWARRIDRGPVINAYGQAMRPGIENRGAKLG